MDKVYAVHLIRTDTCKYGDGSPEKVFAHKKHAEEFCMLHNSQELKDKSLLWCVREYSILYNPIE